MIKLDNSKGKIGELVKEHNLSLHTTKDFKESMETIDEVERTHKGLIALDTETTSLTLWDDGNYLLGYSLSIDNKSGYYFNSRCWTKDENVIFIERLNSLKNDKTFWNWSFDYSFTKGHYGVGLDATHDGMIMFHSLFSSRSLDTLPNSEKKKGYSLKELTKDFTPYGDYESELKGLKRSIITELNKVISTGVKFDKDRFLLFMEVTGTDYEIPNEANNVVKLMNGYIERGVVLKEKDISYGFIPDNVLAPYAACDSLITWELTNRCILYADEQVKNGWDKIYDIIDIKHKATKLYSDASIRGFKVDRKRVMELSEEWKPLREMALADVMCQDEVRKAESLIFRNSLLKEQEKKHPYIASNFSKKSFKLYFRLELTKAQSKRKSLLPLTRCRVIYNLSKTKFNAKKYKAITSSRVSLSKCRSIFNDTVFNLNSPAQKKVLFIDIMKLEPIEFNKKDQNGVKNPKLNGDFVAHYSKRYPFMDKINIYMLYQKGISSFLGTDEKSKAGLWNTTSDNHPYNHSNFRITGTITSRLATSNVNLSQFPSRGVLHKCKDCFVVEDDYKLFTFDFATSELRILASLAEEKTFKEAFEKGLDLHSLTAWNIWQDEMTDIDGTLPLREITNLVKEKYGDTFRFYSKSINFSLPYGTTGVGLGKAIGVPTKQAEQYIEDYRKNNPKIAEYMDLNKDKVMNDGFIEGSYGERLYLKNAKGYDWRATGRRKKNWDAISEYKKSTNFIIQSDNAFLLYKGLIAFQEEISNLNLDISLIATIYDSIYIRVNKKIDDKIIWELLKKHFEVDFYGIPMLIDIGIALNEDKTYSHRWGELKDVKFEELKEIKEINK